MNILIRPLSEIFPYEKNARKIPQSAIDAVARSLKEFGWQQPIVVDTKGVIIVGHVRRLAALQLGWTEAPIHVADKLTAAQIRAYRLMDNRSHEEATWEPGVLNLEMLELKKLDLDLSFTGFSSREIDAILRPAIAGEDDAPPVPDTPFTQPGDLWMLGNHRLLCGDATDPDAVSRVCGEAKPFLMITDPPYGVLYDPTWRDGKGGFSTAAVIQRGKVVNDDRVDWADAYRLFPGSVMYVWHASLKSVEAGQSVADAGFEVRGVIIWRKQQPLFGQGHYHWQHEACWYAVRKGAKANWCGDRRQSTVWDVQNLNPTGNRDEERVGHGAQKPVELMRRPILNHTKSGACVYDPFVGSGTTLIACELTERRCISIDVDPKCCDIAVKRWQNLTGKLAHNQDGVCFPDD